MSNFDAAIGFNATTLNAIAQNLYKQPKARNSIFKGGFKKNVKGHGDVSLEYDVLATPTFTLSPPTAAAWKAAVKKDPAAKLPKNNCFQIHFSKLKVTESIDNGPATVIQNAVDAFCTVVTDAGQIKLTPIAISMDSSKWSDFDKWFIPNVLEPAALAMVGQMLGAYQLPGLPTYEGIQFNDLTLSITNNLLLGVTTITTNKKPLDVKGFKWPSKNYFVMLSPTLLNTVIGPKAAAYNGESKSDSDEKGNKVWGWAKGSYSAKINSVTANVESDPTKININIKPDISVSGSFGGVGPMMACPIGTAMNAM